ncbi:transcriptional regulator [Dyadobacter sandarakinus]|uniref:Transcriptional regulator n=1 Tax=Dyadobacter sandarakinus TaxID=2747268 RepID=A0ABX7I0T7_9BACT|nr:transcriptional regulator [Dyadobacter sandarakinus]QRQ99656.1 transcriptional regulator [Dyadobacter sandarakinus]
METTVYEDHARALIAEIRQLVEAKGLDLTAAMADAGIADETTRQILDEQAIPSLPDFLAMCQISGISFQLPSIETPDTPM